VPRSAQTVSLALMPSLDRTAVDMQCRALFWDLYLPHGLAEVHDAMLMRCNHPPNWTSVLLEMPKDEPALDLAFSALSISRVGRSNQDVRLVKESTKIYGRALKYLQKALNDSSRSQSEEVLAACSLLGLYEVFEGGDAMNKSVGWVSHAQGAARLIELRGPRQHIKRQAHHVFLGARLPILFSAIVRRKKTFLTDIEWLTIPWRDVPVKTYHDILIDHATRIPGLLEQFDNLRAKSSPDTQHSLKELLQSCCELKETMTKWEHGKKQLSRPVLIKHDPQEDDIYPFQHEMSWENHLFFNASLVYWSVQLIISVTISQIELLLVSLGFARAETFASTVTNQQHARQFAICIAQSIPYALMPDMGALGINHITFPICLAFAHFTESNEERICAWLVKVNNDMRRQGIRIRPFDDPVIANHHRDTFYPGKPTGDNKNDMVTGVALTSASEEKEIKTEWPLSPSSAPNGGSFISTFIYENPAKYYYDTTEPG